MLSVMRVTHVMRVMSPNPFPHIIFLLSVTHLTCVMHFKRVMNPSPYPMIYGWGVMHVIRYKYTCYIRFETQPFNYRNLCLIVIRYA